MFYIRIYHIEEFLSDVQVGFPFSPSHHPLVLSWVPALDPPPGEPRHAITAEEDDDAKGGHGDGGHGKRLQVGQRPVGVERVFGRSGIGLLYSRVKFFLAPSSLES